jgi:Ca-activated chloride channel family protein
LLRRDELRDLALIQSFYARFTGDRPIALGYCSKLLASDEENTMSNTSKRSAIIFLAMAVFGPLGSGFGGGAAAEPPKIRLDAGLGTPVVLANKRQSAILRVSLTGFDKPSSSSRSSVNMAIVLDRSSSMAGAKMEKAKEAALMIVDRLSSNDVLSVITYDTSVQVLLPAAPLVDRDTARARIRAIEPAGSTALFAGVSKGIAEVRKFAESERVNRVILLSDGQANVGPSSPNELGRLGSASAKERIAITTFGLGNGYNEDLMTQLALKSDGNHAYIEDPTQLAKYFDLELGDVLSVVAQEIAVKVRLAEGSRPVRVLNREAEIRGQDIVFTLNQLVAKQERYALIEVELEPGAINTSRRIADVDVSYQNMVSGATDRLAAPAAVAFTASTTEVDARANKAVMVAAVEAIANDNNRMALELRDKGKVKEAKELLLLNSQQIQLEADRWGSEKLKDSARLNFEDSEKIDEEETWNENRKAMRKNQQKVETQSTY